MKRQLKKLTLSFLAMLFFTHVNAQTWSGSTPGTIYYDGGNVAIGATSSSKPLYVYSDDIDQVAVFESGDGIGGIELRDSGTTAGNVMLRAINNDLSLYAGGALGFRITSNGNVGIGTPTPSTRFQVRQEVNTAISASHTASSTISGLRLTNLSTTANAGAVINFQLGSTGTSHAAIAASRPSADNNILHFYTEHSNTIAERMRIESNGNVGIGAPTPLTKLHVSSGTAGDGVVRIEADTDNNNENDNARIELMQDGGTLGAYIGFNTDWGGDWEIGNSFRIGVRHDSNDIYDAFVIKNSNGYIGVNETNPSSRLSIYGTTAEGWNSGLQLNREDGGEGQIVVDASGMKLKTTKAGDHFYFRNSGNGTTFLIKDDGNVAIGTTTPATGYKLSVAGKIISEEVKVKLQSSGWPDYVFSKNYKLKTLEETENYIKEEGHLPNIPSANEVAENGIQLGEMNAKLLEKIEELTLHLIEQNKKMDRMQKENELMKSDIKKLQDQLD